MKKALKKHQLNFVEEICITSRNTGNGRKLKPKGRSKMSTTRKRKMKLQRPSQYPLPQGLLTGF